MFMYIDDACCFSHMQFSGEVMELISGAKSGRHISQCTHGPCPLSCSNGGTPVVDDTSYVCSCPLGFTGFTCEQSESHDSQLTSYTHTQPYLSPFLTLIMCVLLIACACACLNLSHILLSL